MADDARGVGGSVAFVHLVCGERSQGDMRAAKLWVWRGAGRRRWGSSVLGEGQFEGKGGGEMGRGSGLHCRTRRWGRRRVAFGLGGRGEVMDGFVEGKGGGCGLRVWEAMGRVREEGCHTREIKSASDGRDDG